MCLWCTFTSSAPPSPPPHLPVDTERRCIGLSTDVFTQSTRRTLLIRCRMADTTRALERRMWVASMSCSHPTRGTRVVGMTALLVLAGTRVTTTGITTGGLVDLE